MWYVDSVSYTKSKDTLFCALIDPWFVCTYDKCCVMRIFTSSGSMCIY